MATQRPVMKFRAGPISCAVWDNEVMVNGKATTVLRATVERRYKDAGGSWHSSNSFSRNDLFLAVWCLERALDAMIQRSSAEVDDGPNGEASDL